ncbi:cytochrome c [Myxococcota bacterium]|nr:cytochrome c [Myxococcota bacterium]
MSGPDDPDRTPPPPGPPSGPPGPPPDEETDVAALHPPLVPEPAEPVEGEELTPWWVWILSALALFLSGFYLARHGGVFGPVVHLAYRDGGAPQGAGAPEPSGAPAAVSGEELYAAHCAPCHGSDGRGVPGTFPPLFGSEWVTGDPEVPVRIVLHGLAGPIVVGGAAYDGAMPALGARLGDAEVAAVVTYERERGGVVDPAVSPERVAGIREATRERATPWTADELRAPGTP